MNEPISASRPSSLAMLGGAIRVSTPFLFVSLGECLTEKSGPHQSRPRGHARLRRHGRLRRSPMMTGSPWLGVLAAGLAGLRLRRAARLHLQAAQGQRHRHRHRPDAVRHRPRLLLRQALHPAAGAAPAVDPARLAGRTTRRSRRRSQVNPLFLVGIAARRRPVVGVPQHALGPDRAHDRRQSPPAARAMGYSVDWVRFLATAAGGFSRRRRRRLPVALLSRAAGTRACRRARA